MKIKVNDILRAIAPLEGLWKYGELLKVTGVLEGTVHMRALDGDRASLCYVVRKFLPDYFKLVVMKEMNALRGELLFD